MNRTSSRPAQGILALVLAAASLFAWTAAVPCRADDTSAATTPPAATPAAAAPATAPADPPAPKVVLSGLVDVYYLWQFSNPKAHSLPQNNLFVPWYDSRYNTPSLSLAELNVSMAPPSTGGLQFKATLQSGDTADIDHGGLGTDPAVYDEARYKNIQQLYVTDLAKSGWGADIGEFYTPFGYEVVESNANYNYSRSLPFQGLLPIYHTGIRVYTPSMKGLVATLYVVRALNNSATEGVNDDNSQPGYIGQLNYADPKGKYTAIETFGYSEDEVSGTSTSDKVTLSDTDFTYNLDPTSLVGLNYTYRKDDYSSPPDSTSDGYAGYYRNQVSKANAIALRYSAVDVKPSGMSGFHPWEATVTLENKTASNMLTRLEYRHDAANVKAYADSSGNPTKKSQDTVSVSEVFTF